MLTVATRNESLDLFLPPIEGGEDTPVHLGVSVCERMDWKRKAISVCIPNNTVVKMTTKEGDEKAN